MIIDDGKEEKERKEREQWRGGGVFKLAREIRAARAAPPWYGTGTGTVVVLILYWSWYAWIDSRFEWF